jgi:hypothetical protein
VQISFYYDFKIDQVITQILPLLESNAQLMRSIKTNLIVAVGELLADEIWVVLNKSDILHLSGKLAEFQVARSSGDDRFDHVIKEVAHTASERIKRRAYVSEREWQLGVSPHVYMLIKSSDSQQFVTFLFHEILRSLRRRPTSRASIYQLFVDFHVDRGKCLFVCFF